MLTDSENRKVIVPVEFITEFEKLNNDMKCKIFDLNNTKIYYNEFLDNLENVIYIKDLLLEQNKIQELLHRNQKHKKVFLGITSDPLLIIQSNAVNFTTKTALINNKTTTIKTNKNWNLSSQIQVKPSNKALNFSKNVKIESIISSVKNVDIIKTSTFITPTTSDKFNNITKFINQDNKEFTKIAKIIDDNQITTTLKTLPLNKFLTKNIKNENFESIDYSELTQFSFSNSKHDNKIIEMACKRQAEKPIWGVICDLSKTVYKIND